MKILIVGGSRFFGKRLAAQWLAAGAEVTLLARGTTDDGFGERVQRLVGDRRELGKDAPLLGDRRWDIVYDQVCFDSFEAEGAVNAFRGRCGRYVFTSTQSVYRSGAGLRESDFDPREHAYPERITRDRDYGEAKRQAEAWFFAQKDFPLCAVRFPMVFGEDDYTRRLHWHVERVKNAEDIYFPNLEARIAFVDSVDAARTLRFLGTHDFVGPINACSADALSLRQVLDLVEEGTGRIAHLAPTVDEDGKNHSPMGLKADWFMNPAKLTELGLPLMPHSEWLGPLIRKLCV